MEQKVFIEGSLQLLKNTQYPVDYVQQYNAIMDRIEHRAEQRTFLALLRPLAIAAVVLLVAAGVWHPSTPTVTADATDVFLAASFAAPYSDVETPAADPFVSYIDGSTQDGTSSDE